MVQRNTAYKVWVSSLHSGAYVKQEGQWESNYVKINELEVSRVNIIATVVQKYENSDTGYYSVTIDDGSDTIRVKAWGEDSKLISGLNVGDMIKIIAKPKEYNNEVYLTPEIVKLVDDQNWLGVRKLELIKAYGKPTKKEFLASDYNQKQEETSIPEEENLLVVKEEKLENTDKRQAILKLIEKLGDDNGIEEERILIEANYAEGEVKEVLQDLLKEGEIYEPKPGRIKLLQ